jgi:hypothetical protein
MIECRIDEFRAYLSDAFNFQALSYVQKFEQAHQYSEEDLKLAREQIEEGSGIHERG